MKVLGTTDGGYVCEISHTEIEKFLNLYYGQKKLKQGTEEDKKLEIKIIGAD